MIDGDVQSTALPTDQRNKDLGWMLYDIDFANDRLPMFYRPVMVDGVIDVTKHRPVEARR